MVKFNLNGDDGKDYIVQMMDYLADPTIKSKNYIVIGDVNSAIRQLEKSKGEFEQALSKIQKLADEVYPVHTRADSQLSTP